ncbi:MAG: hypothetical protein ACYSWT_04125 [Planctomycetota bacterium]
MSPRAHAGRGVAATLALVGAIMFGLPGPAPAARSDPHDGGTPASIDSAEVISAWLTLRRWVNEFSLPAPEGTTAGIPLANAAGVCVILRQAGRVVGTGVDSSAGDLMVRRAAGRALGAVLADPAAAALPAEMQDHVGRALTLELEVAAAPVPLLGSTFKDVAAQLDPGRDGVAMRRGDRWAMLFPAQARAANTAGRLERLLPSLATELGLAPMEIGPLGERFGVSVYRFRAVHLAQPTTADPPFITFRGDDLVLDRDVTRAALEDLARRIAEHLRGTLAPHHDPLGIMGTYRPISDRYDPLIAPPLEQALSAWALARYGRLRGHSEPVAQRATATAEHVLGDLGQVAPGQQDPLADPVACAGIVVAVTEDRNLLDQARVAELFAGARDRVRTAYARGDGFTGGDEAAVAPNGQALIAWAMSRLLVTGSADIDPGLVRSAIDAAWASVPESRQISLLPWLGWAEAAWAAAAGRPTPRAQRLQAIRRLADASRVGSPDRPGPPDLAGGLALTGGGRPAATAQTLRPAAYLAWMVRQPDLTPPAGEAEAALDRVLSTARFVMQLSVREPSLWAYRNPGRALGGIRAAPWDCDQPVPAQALGLVFAAETLASYDAVAPRRGAPPDTP